MAFFHIIKSMTLFFLPTKVVRWFSFLFRSDTLKIGKNCHIGFSYIDCEKLELADNSRIGHFNFIHVDKLKMGGAK